MDHITPAARLGKLVRLLSSPQDHEILGAVRAILKAYGGDIHRLASLVESIGSRPRHSPNSTSGLLARNDHGKSSPMNC
jgi:hypothetical protein